MVSKVVDIAFKGFFEFLKIKMMKKEEDIKVEEDGEIEDVEIKEVELEEEI